MAAYLDKELDELTTNNKVDYAVVYGEFFYETSSWGYPRRIVVKAEKPSGQLVYMYTFVVINMDMKPEDIIRFYCNRGKMENFIIGSKRGFDMDTMSSHSMTVNENRLQIFTTLDSRVVFYHKSVNYLQFNKSS